MGTYRIQVHEKNLLGLWQSPGQQGREIAERYWKEGKPCPVVITFGGDPLLFMASYTKFAWGVSELEGAGGIMGRPVEVIPGPLTGLPIPAHAEIAIEGEIPPPDVESREEGPYGEWTGYYAGGTLGTGEDQPVIRVKAVYYRDDPILLNMAPQWPGAPHHGVRFEGGILWDQLEAAGVPGIKGAYIHNAFLAVIAIEQRYAGHAKQTGMAALGCAAAARNGRFIVIVDDDIDPSNMNEVWWAMTSRCDPASDIDIIENCWASPLDPRMPRDVAKSGPHVNSRAIMQAVRPWAWRDEFPKVNRIDAHERDAMVEKFKDLLPFPRT
jgi:4-hydroxy-3-polyprenylbenzoate decarboxylase